MVKHTVEPLAMPARQHLTCKFCRCQGEWRCRMRTCPSRCHRHQSVCKQHNMHVRCDTSVSVTTSDQVSCMRRYRAFFESLTTKSELAGGCVRHAHTPNILRSCCLLCPLLVSATSICWLQGGVASHRGAGQPTRPEAAVRHLPGPECRWRHEPQPCWHLDGSDGRFAVRD